MAQVRTIQTNFTGGEISPLLSIRVDTSKYQNGCKQLDNFVVMPYGGVKRRTGTKYVSGVKSMSQTGVLVRFQYSTEQAYVLFFGPSYIRVYTPGGAIVTQAAQNITGITKANPAVVTYSGADTYANGDRVIITGVVGMTEVNNREFTVANVNAGANTFELSGVNSTSYGTYSSGGQVAEIFEIATTYTEGELPDLRFTQSSDVLYIAHKDHALAKLERSAALTWTLSDVTIIRGPWRELNNDETITIKANDWTGSGITLEASAASFFSGHVGSRYKLYTPSNGKYDTEWGTDTVNNIAVGDFWAYNGNSYEITATTLGAETNQYAPPTHQIGTVRHYQGGKTANYSDIKFLHKGYGIVEITGYTDTTHLTGTVYTGYGYAQLPRQLADPAMTGGAAANAAWDQATSLWQEGAWSAYRGYPGIITFFEQRLMAACNNSEQQTIWGSVSGNLTDFEEGPNDAQALNYTIASEEADIIRWMVPGKQLLIGTISGEYVMQSSSLNEAVTPKNVRISRETKFGSSKVQPLRIGPAVIFVQRHGDPDNYGRKVREMSYDFQLDGFQSVDLSIWAEHITGTGLTGLEFQGEPDGVIWAPRADGYIAALTYQREQEIVAWHRHFLGGFSNSAQDAVPVVESIISIPGDNGDELWMLVKRYINGATVRYIEVLSYSDRYTDKADMIYLDSAITYSGASATVITGLWHLIGQTVTVLGNGSSLGDFTVSATGTITLPSAVTKAQIGLKYKSAIKTNDLEAGMPQGSSAQGAKKRISHVVGRFERSLGGSFGVDADGPLDPILYRTPQDTLGSSVELYTGDQQLKLPSAWSNASSFYIETEGPFPLTLLGVVSEVSATG